MHRLAVVPQSLLREPFRVATFQSPFRPRIPIRMQRHTRNFQPDTALTKLRCPVPSAYGAKVREKQPNRRTPFQEGLDFRAKANQRRFDANPAARFQFRWDKPILREWRQNSQPTRDARAQQRRAGSRIELWPQALISPDNRSDLINQAFTLRRNSIAKPLPGGFHLRRAAGKPARESPCVISRSGAGSGNGQAWVELNNRKQMKTIKSDKMRPLQKRRSGFSAESRTPQFAGEIRRSADRRYDERKFCRGLKI